MEELSCRGMSKNKVRIWDRQTRSFVDNGVSLHCFSNWMVDAFSGELIDFVGVVDGQSRPQTYTASPNPDWYADGRKLAKGKRYVSSEFTGAKEPNGAEIYEGDILRRGDAGHRYVCEWSDDKAAYVLRNVDGGKDARLTDLLPKLKLVGNIFEEQGGREMKPPKRRRG